MYIGTEYDSQDNVYKTHLQKLLYIAYPSADDIKKYEPTQGDTPPKDERLVAFIGQIPNAIPLQYLSWAIDTLLETRAVYLSFRGRKSGCARVYFRTEEFFERALELSCRIIFDIQGVFIAKTEEQIQILTDFTNELRAGFKNGDKRLPKGALVMERLGQPKQQTQAAPDLGCIPTIQIADQPRVVIQQPPPPYVRPPVFVAPQRVTHYPPPPPGYVTVGLPVDNSPNQFFGYGYQDAIDRVARMNSAAQVPTTVPDRQQWGRAAAPLFPPAVAPPQHGMGVPAPSDGGDLVCVHNRYAW